jgi:hypothetical protein
MKSSTNTTARTKLIFKILVLNTVMFICVSGIKAQTPAVLDGTPGGETGGDGNGGFGDGPVVPLDGGLSCILLASAIGYGLRQSKQVKERVIK